MEPTYSLPVYVTCSILEHDRLTPGEARALVALYTRAYDEVFDAWWAAYAGAVHVLLLEGGQIIAAACWLDRPLQQENRPFLRTAYVEGVAVEPGRQGQGYGRAVMGVIAQQVWDYELAALSTGEFEFYAKLGWERWLGPTFVRTALGLLPTVDDAVMVLRTGRTPAWLDPAAPLSCNQRAAPDQW